MGLSGVLNGCSRPNSPPHLKLPVLFLVLCIELINPISSSFSEMKASFLRDILAEVEEKDTELG